MCRERLKKAMVKPRVADRKMVMVGNGCKEDENNASTLLQFCVALASKKNWFGTIMYCGARANYDSIRDHLVVKNCIVVAYASSLLSTVFE